MSKHVSQPPQPPYYAVIFSSHRSEDTKGYGAMAKAMFELAHQQAGFLGVESVGDENGSSITVSYWQDEASILAWKQNNQHQLAQKKGMEQWYAHYDLRVAKVERAYSGPDGREIS